MPHEEEFVIFEGRPSMLLLVRYLIVNMALCGAAVFAYFNHIGTAIDLITPHLPPTLPALYIDNLPLGVRGLIGFIIFITAWNLTVGTLSHFVIHYRITNQRVQEERGILNRHIDNVEIARITDIELRQPLLLRLFGYGNVILLSSDRTSPRKELRGIPGVRKIMEKLTHAIKPHVIHEIR